jgi:hypothetical protein
MQVSPLRGTRTAAPLTAKLFAAGTPLAGKVFRPVKRFIYDERLRNSQKGHMELRRAIVSAASQPLSFWPPVLESFGTVRKGHSRSASETPPGSALWQGSAAVPVRQDEGYGDLGLASSCSCATPFAGGARSTAKIWRIRSSRLQTNSPQNPNKFFIFFVVIPHYHEVSHLSCLTRVRRSSTTLCSPARPEAARGAVLFADDRARPVRHDPAGARLGPDRHQQAGAGQDHPLPT